MANYTEEMVALLRKAHSSYISEIKRLEDELRAKADYAHWLERQLQRHYNGVDLVKEWTREADSAANSNSTQ